MIKCIIIDDEPIARTETLIKVIFAATISSGKSSRRIKYHPAKKRAHNKIWCILNFNSNSLFVIPCK